MRKNHWFKRHEKGIVTGFCAAVLTVTGIAGYHIQDSYGYTYCYDKNGAVTFVISDPDAVEVTQDTAETYAKEGTWESGIAQDREAAYDFDGTWEASGTEIASDSYERWYSENQFYEDLGMKWDKKEEYWTYEGKPVRIIWEEDGCFSSWGNTGTDYCTYIYVSKEAGDGSVTYRLNEMTKDEINRLYQKEHPGSRIE